MAFLDTERGQLVIRIVFDGNPLSGKTTTARSLAESLGAKVESPEEMLGRTIFFDWLEYTGGLWNGHKIRCQILTVPGQASLGARRFELLRLADCIVFVFDTSKNQSADSVTTLEELGCVLNACPEPRPKVLLQLNKRDLPNALPREELDAILPGEYQDVAETIASDCVGIRDVFVRAVRLALSRVEELEVRGDLPLCRPNIEDCAALLASMKAQEQGEGESLSQTVPLEAAAWNFLRSLEDEEGPLDSEPKKPPSEWTLLRSDGKGPLLPSADIPTGAVWPPARGRTNLQQFTELPSQIGQRSEGDWEVRFGPNWRGLSRADHIFEDFDQGRQQLLELTRKAIKAEEWLSPNRCLVLSPADSSTWRLWEIMPQTTPLEALLLRRREASAEVIAAALVQVFHLYNRSASQWPEEKINQRLSPKHSGLFQTRLVYTGFLALPRQAANAPMGKAPAIEELRELALTYLEAQGLHLGESISHLRALEATAPELAEMAGRLAHLLSSADEDELLNNLGLPVTKDSNPA